MFIKLKFKATLYPVDIVRQTTINSDICFYFPDWVSLAVTLSSQVDVARKQNKSLVQNIRP